MCAVICFYFYCRLTLTCDIKSFTTDINNKPFWKYVPMLWYRTISPILGTVMLVVTYYPEEG